MKTEPTSSNNIGYPLQKQKLPRPPNQTQRIDNAQNVRRSPKGTAKKPEADFSDIVTKKERDFIQRLFPDRGMFRSYRIASAPTNADVRLGSKIDVKA